MTNPPEFSVVIPLYNKAPFVARAIQSVLSQTVHCKQIVVVDDGSTDTSRDIARSFDDHRITVIEQINSGEGEARNTGIRNATGDWIAFLDADDMWLPDHLEELTKIAKLYPDSGLIATQLVHARHGCSFTAPRDIDSIIILIDYFDEATRQPAIVSSTTAAINRSRLGPNIRFGNFTRGADTEFWARIALNHNVAISTRQTAVYFRSTGGIIDTLVERDLIYSTPPTTTSDISPSIARAWAASREPEYTKRSSIKKYASHYTSKHIRAALYQGHYQTAVRTAELAGAYKLYFQMLHLVLRARWFSKPALRILRTIRHQLRR